MEEIGNCYGSAMKEIWLRDVASPEGSAAGAKYRWVNYLFYKQVAPTGHKTARQRRANSRHQPEAGDCGD